MFRFPSPRLLWWWVGRSGNKTKKKRRMNTWRGLGSGALLQRTTRKRGLFNYQTSKQPLKNVVSMLIKDKDITSYQLLLILKQDRVLVN